MMNEVNDIDWSKAPEWANAVVSSSCGTLFYVEQFGGVSKRQRTDSNYLDHNEANMQNPHTWTLVATRPSVWNGQGLPPLNTTCLYTMQTNRTSPNWYECTVTYAVGDGSGVVALCKTFGVEIGQFLSAETTLFKPLPVKSKADAAKEKAITTILEDVTSIWASSDVELAEQLYKLGYTKDQKKGD
jgi:hypothetical protein